MNIFWAPKSSNKKLYNFKNKKLEKKVWKTKKKWKTNWTFWTPKSSKSSDFLGDKKIWTFWRKKVQKVQSFFLKKIKNGTFWTFGTFCFFFDFQLYLIRKSKKFQKFKKFKKFHFWFFQKKTGWTFWTFFSKKFHFFLSPKKKLNFLIFLGQKLESNYFIWIFEF